MWAEFAMFIKSKIFRKIWKEASLVEDTKITEDGVYFIHIVTQEGYFSVTAYLGLDDSQNISFGENGKYYLAYNPNDKFPFKVFYKDTNVEEYNAMLTVYRLI